MNKCFSLGLAIVAALLFCCSAAYADLIWDNVTTNGTTVDEGAGTWIDGGNNWQNLPTPAGNVQWDNDSPTVAQFGNTVATTAYAQTVSGEVTATGLSFKRVYNLSGGTINLSGATSTIAFPYNTADKKSLQPLISSSVTANNIDVNGYAYTNTSTYFSFPSFSGVNNITGTVHLTAGLVGFRGPDAIPESSGGLIGDFGTTIRIDLQGDYVNAPTTHISGWGYIPGLTAPDATRGAFQFAGFTGTAVWRGNIVLDGNASIAANHTSTDAKGDITGVISEANPGTKLVKCSHGDITLSGNNTYTGGTEIYNGPLWLNAAVGPAILGNVTFTCDSLAHATYTPALNLMGDNQLQSTAVVAFNGNTRSQTMNLRGNDLTVAGISSPATDEALHIIQNNLAESGAGTLTVNVPSEASPSYTGTIQDNAAATANSVLALVKSGSGSLTIDGANCGLFTGGLTVSGGTLALGANGPTSFSSPMLLVQENGTLNVSAKSGFTVAAGQTLKGKGSIVGDIVAAAGSSLEPGESIGTLTVTGNLAVSGGLEIEYDSDADMIDQLAVTGNLDLTNAAITFSDLGTGALAPGAYVFATYIGGTLTQPTNAPTPPVGTTIDWAYSGNQVALVVIPEPSTVILLALAGLALAAFRRRRS